MVGSRESNVGSRVATAALLLALQAGAAGALEPVVPPAQRGRIDAERSGFHDAARIRTVFWNYGMVGDYPADPGNVDLSVFHSAEVPKGSGMNYTDGITPFVLARIRQRDGSIAYIMETGYRERQAISPTRNRTMRFEPRPGFFQADPGINRARSPAISNDPRTWPDSWPDKANDPDDRGWAGQWNGYFGKRAAADQESFMVMDDDFYEAWDYFADSRDTTRRGLGLRVEVRGFQWANPQAGNVIFWHYDITNESTTDYVENIIFGLYMDSGVGGSALSCDGIYESDDDNAFFDKSSGLNLVYTWDKFGHGKDLSGLCGRTGYLGYAYLETPGKPFDGQDNDGDGFTDEQRDGGPGTPITGQANIRSWWASHYDTTRFVAFYGPLAKRPAYRKGVWWTGDEDLDWKVDLDDVGADGVPDTDDTGEGDGMPTEGEPNFDRTDLNESDQIGLTGFKMNRIRAGAGNPDPTVDDIVFFTDANRWPERLYQKFTDPNPAARFDSALAANYNIGFFFASGPFTLLAGKRERFSLALAFGQDLNELRNTVKVVQNIYNANYQFAVPPPQPVVKAEAGDGYVRLTWDDVAERAVDPVTGENDFEGYRIYRSTDPQFRDPQLVPTGSNTLWIPNGKPIAQFDLVDGKFGWSDTQVEGVSYYLGNDSGITHTWTDTTVVNGQQYYYAVCAYDFGFEPQLGSDSLAFFPSENSISVSLTPRGGFIAPLNVAAVRPEPPVPGYRPATVGAPAHVAGDGSGSVEVRVLNSALVPDGHLFAVRFTADPESVHAAAYTLVDSLPARDVLFSTGKDFDGAGIGPVGAGLLPIVKTGVAVTVDTSRSGFRPGSVTRARLNASYQPSLPFNLRRPGYPDDISITFYDQVVDTSLAAVGLPRRPAKFKVVAHGPAGDIPLKFRFFEVAGKVDSTLSDPGEFIEIVTYAASAPTTPRATWYVVMDPQGPLETPSPGDVYDLKLTKPFGAFDEFTFTTGGQRVDPTAARVEFQQQAYVVPNPYVGAASFEPERFATSGRGVRRMEFRGLPQNATVRIYTVRGALVQTLRQDGSTSAMAAWDLRSKDNLDVAPGLYLFEVEAPGVGKQIGKFAIIK